jgi:CRISPR-associated endonuclease/helicase Cas3
VSYDASKGPGRVFFSNEVSLKMDWIAYQPLKNHVCNVRKLLEKWRTDTEISDLAIPKSKRTLLYQGAEDHDWGKTQKFGIDFDKGRWIYKFRGHPYLNPRQLEEAAESNADSFYALKLERLHHHYSVEKIVEAAYELKNSKLDIDHTRFPQDLFVLEMCDQIEAEVAVMAVDAQKDGRNPNFMEFEVKRKAANGEEQVFILEPFPFEDEVSYDVVVRRDDVKGQKLESSNIKQRGFDPYDDVEIIKIRLQGSEHFAAKQTDISKFYEVATGNAFQPHQLQCEVWEYWQQESVGLIVKAPTGVGKTEACVYPPLAHRQRVLLVLPAKALVDDHKQRLTNVLLNLSKDGIKRRLLVDTGDTVELNEICSGKIQRAEFFSEKRHLYRADVIITTLDKMLYRFFGYGGGRKSYIYPLRINDTKRMALVFDEAHSYEGTAFTNFQRLVNALYDHQHNIILMTATLPEQFQQALRDSEKRGFAGRWEVVDYLEKQKQTALLEEIQASSLELAEYYGQRQMSFIPDDETVDFAAIEDFETKKEQLEDLKQQRFAKFNIQERWTGNNRLITTLDAVKDAAEIYKKLRSLPHISHEGSDSQNLFLYHGRLDPRQRTETYRRLKQRDSQQAPYIAVTTSAIEIGVDLDANMLITELCNPDSLVQRMGRCNRKGKDASAEVVVFGSHIPEYLDAFGDNQEAFETYLQVLQTHHGKMVDGDFAKTVMDIFPKPVLINPRAVTAYDMFYKYVYDFELEYKNLHDLGFIATRSSIPTIDILIPVGKDKKGNLEYDRVTVPVNRLSRGTDDAEWVTIERYRMQQDKDKSWSGSWEVATYGGDLTKANIRIILDEDSPICQNYQRELGLVDVPRIFKQERWNNDPPLLRRLSTWAYERSGENSGAFFFATGEIDGKGKGKRLVFQYLADPDLEEF